MKFTLAVLVASLFIAPGTGQIDYKIPFHKTPACKTLIDKGFDRSTVECVASAAEKNRLMDCFEQKLILAADAQLAFKCNADTLDMKTYFMDQGWMHNQCEFYAYNPKNIFGMCEKYKGYTYNPNDPKNIG